MQNITLNKSRSIDIFIHPDIQKLFSLLESFLNQKINQYNRFIFLYNIEDLDFENKVNNRFLFLASEIAIDELFSFLCQTEEFKVENKYGNVTRMVQFQEFKGHIIQKVSLAYPDAITFLKNIDADDNSNLLIFHKLDRLCYRTSTLMQLDSLIQLLPSSCSYVFLSDNIYNKTFYEWIAHKLKRELYYCTDKGEEKKDFSPEFIELNEVIRFFLKETDLDANLPLLKDRLSELQQPLTEMKYFFSDSLISIKEHCIKHYRNTSELKRYWVEFRKFVLGLLLYIRLTSYRRKEKILVISDSFDGTQWQDFLLEYECSYNQQSTYPKFKRIKEAKTDSHLFRNVELVIIDIGDEITNNSQEILIENFLAFSSSIYGILDSTEILFIQPILISEQFFSYLLTHPPVPYRLGYFYEPKAQQKELKLITLLFSALQYQMKSDYYQCVVNSWMISTKMNQNDTNILSWSEEILELRLSGLLDINYYQTTVLGKWFLYEELNISDFISFLKKENSSLFKTQEEKTNLSHITENDIEKLFLSSIDWFFHTTKYRTLDSQYMDSFQLALIDAWHLKQQSTSFLFKADEYLLQLIQNEPEGSPEIHLDMKDTSKDGLLFPSKRQAIPQRGRVLDQVLNDIEEWMAEFEESSAKFPPESFFDIQKHAIEAAEESRKKEKESIHRSPYSKYIQAYTRSYFRAVKKLMHKQWRTTLTYLRYLGTIRGSDQYNYIEPRIKKIRTRLKVQQIRLQPQKTHNVLIFKEREIFPHHSPVSTAYFHQTCDTCYYFKKELKKECKFFNLAALKRKNIIPDHLKERLEGIFSKEVACPMWRPTKPIRLQIPTKEQFCCAICAQYLEHAPRWDQPVRCDCQAEYHWISRHSAKKGFYRYQLSENHRITYDIRLLDPKTPIASSFDQIEEDLLEPFHPTQRLDLYPEEVTPPRLNDETYVFIHETDIIQYSKKQKVLRLESPLKRNRGLFKKQESIRTYTSEQIRVIDTCKLFNALENILDTNPHAKINYRRYQLILKREDKASIIKKRNVPELKVRYYRKRDSYSYPLSQIASVFNIGKPRLTPQLDRWGVKVRYQATKGVNKETADEIVAALELPGVRNILRKMHLFGLLLSNINATAQVIGLAEKYKKNELSRKLTLKMKKMLFFRQKRWREFYREFPNKSLKQINAFEGEIFRPFASGIRSLVEKVQDPLEPLIQRDYGRTVARRIQKKHKEDAYDSMGGYTPFDAANNCINRSLRTPLRLLNARTEIGFRTCHLFSHTSKDNPWKSGHLDLEEVGRIITRIFLAHEIVERELMGKHFETRFDDDFTPYYVPYSWTWNMLRTQVVNRKILPLELWYQGQSMAYIEAHKCHVENLCTCLRTCREISDFSERQKYLLENYQPLIYNSKVQNAKSNEVLSDFLHIFMILWIKNGDSSSDHHKDLLKDINQTLYKPAIVTDLLTAV